MHHFFSLLLQGRYGKGNGQEYLTEYMRDQEQLAGAIRAKVRDGSYEKKLTDAASGTKTKLDQLSKDLDAKWTLTLRFVS